MTVEDLQADIERNIAELDARPLSTIDDVKAYLKDTVLPLFAATGSALEEIDDDLSDLVEHADDILQPETAAVFALVIKGAVEVSDALRKRLRPNNENDAKWIKRLDQLRAVCETAGQRLLEITVQPEPEEDDVDPSALDDAPPAPLSIVPSEVK